MRLKVCPLVLVGMLICRTALASDEPVEAADQAEADLIAKDVADALVIKEERDDEISIDAEGSLAVPDVVKDGVRRRWATAGDLRVAGIADRQEISNDVNNSESEITARFRYGANWKFSDSLRAVGRLALSCTSDACKPDELLDQDSIGSTSDGLVVDEAFLHWFRSEFFDVAAGRLQTKFVTRGGVFAKSLDRNDSNATRVTWTDGIHGTYEFKKGWTSHLIVQYNPEDGPNQVLRRPLDFSDSGSRASYFTALESDVPRGLLTQRGFDISYFPDSLRKDGIAADSRVEDYWGFVGRMAMRYPKRSKGRRFRFSAEVGYAPETPTNLAVELGEEGDADGLAWALTGSVMDMFENHSLGLNYAHTGAGWLLSPQYSPNQELVELRYVWVANRTITVDARIRRREDLEKLTAANKLKQYDAFLRMTWRFQKNR